VNALGFRPAQNLKAETSAKHRKKKLKTTLNFFEFPKHNATDKNNSIRDSKLES